MKTQVFAVLASLAESLDKVRWSRWTDGTLLAYKGELPEYQLVLYVYRVLNIYEAVAVHEGRRAISIPPEMATKCFGLANKGRA